MLSLIHPKSSITPLSEFDLFTVPPTQLTVEKNIVTEHRPISTLNPNSIIEFNIETAVDEYIQMRDMLFYLKLKVDITKTTAGDITEDDWKKISPVNNFMHSIFKTIDIEINGKSITMSPQTYAYKAFFETYLGYTVDAKVSHLTSVGYYSDTDKKTAIDNDQSEIIRPNPVNIDGSGREIELMGKLLLDLAQQPKALIGGLKIKITLIPNDIAFYLWRSDATINPTISFSSAKLYVTRSKVAFPVVEAHNQALMKGNAKYPINRGIVKTITVNSGALDINLDNVISGQIPRTMFVALVSNTAYTGNLNSNPYEFKHYDLRYLAAYIDGEQFPTIAFSPNFSKRLYMREYLSLFEALNLLSTESNFDIEHNDYRLGNTIFGFNLSPDTSDDYSKSGYVNPIRKGSVGLSLKFGTALPETINVIVYSEFENIIEIDANRNAITDYV